MIGGWEPTRCRTERRSTATVVLSFVVLGAASLTAQTPPASAPAGVDHMAEEVARHIAVLAHDSLHGRAAPSPGLEQAAQYVAAQFAAFGLRPGQQVPRRNGWRNQDTTWLQRYPIPGQRRLEYKQSRLTFTTTLHRRTTKILSEGGQEVAQEVRTPFTSTARFADTLMPRFDLEDSRPVVLVAGPQTAASIAAADLHGKIVVYVPPSGAGIDAGAQRAARQALAAQSHGLVLLPETDSLRFAAAVQAAQAAGVPVADDYLWDAALGSWTIEVWPNALRGLLAANGIDLAAVRATPTPLVRALPFVQVEYQAWPVDVPVDSLATLPIVTATLEGSDSALKREYIAIVAHLDQTGRPRGGPTRLTHGADDNASGVAALLALAQAFSRPEARLKRSLVFLATTGGGTTFWGTHFFLHNQFPGCVLGVTLDMLGRPAGDSVVVEGAEELELTPSPAWVAAAHPEVGVTVVDTGTVFRPTADHYPFSRLAISRNGIPSLYVHAGTGAHATPRAQDDADAVDPVQEARLVRLVYHLVYGLGNAPERPRWNAVGRAHARVGEP